ncbi:MAG TPA: ferrous iron transport protein A [Firmicutes bacterium]|nr:ferrous iron transport protein A [Candidatus Fermentithermobacillaceae bacterium]
MGLHRTLPGRSYEVVRILGTKDVDGVRRQYTAFRLEELGIYPGQTVRRLGSRRPGRTVIVEVLGCRVALSTDLARNVLVKALGDTIARRRNDLDCPDHGQVHWGGCPADLFDLFHRDGGNAMILCV